MRLGFIGLGQMGFRIAKNISYKHKINIWNRTESVSDKFNNLYNSEKYNNISKLSKNTDILFTCLPTSDEVSIISKQLINDTKEKKYLIDITSGDYEKTVKIHNYLQSKNIEMLDCPVSGGPEKAEMGNLTAMVSGNIEDYNKIKDYINLFSNTNYTGPIGSSHAIKSINNLLNVSNLIIANEGINALSKLGINPEIALNVINKSSGRSLMTEERMPNDIINNKFNYGFKLNLMKKDVDLALDLIDSKEYFKPILEQINKTLKKNKNDCDYTYVCKK